MDPSNIDKEKLLEDKKNIVDHDSAEEEDEEDLEDEDYESNYKDDILRPASTRSKIVVNLIEPNKKNDSSKRQPFGPNDQVKYELDKYDKVRMQLLLPDQALYKAYKKTIDKLEEEINLQPRKRKMPCWYLAPAELIVWLLMIIVIYIFFLVIQLALFNLVIVGIIIVFTTKFWQFLQAFKDKFQFTYKTKDFLQFIGQQNVTVYNELDIPIEIQSDREGCWLEFMLKDDEMMFEQEIAKRRQQIFNDQDNAAIEEMKKILNDYSKEKDKEE